MNFDQLNIIVGFSSGLVGLVMGGGAAFRIAQKLYDARAANDKEEIESLDKLARTRGEKIERLEMDCKDLARSVLKKYTNETKDGNYAQGIAGLEEWFQSQKEDIGTITRHLANHYVSYFEPEIMHDSFARAERAATLASLCLDDPKEVHDLLHEVKIIVDENSSAKVDARFKRALDVIEDYWGPSNPDDAQNFVNAATERAQENIRGGRYWIALHLARRANAVAERSIPNEEERLSALSTLVGALYHVGRYTESETLGRRALAISEKALGPEHLQTATSLNNLANLATSLNNLAASLRAQGDYAGAKPLYERALAITEKALGPEHPQTAMSLNNLALLLWAQRDYASAKPLYERALAISEKALGPEHLQTATALNNLAALLRDQGDYAGAKPLCERALAISEKALGAEHPQTAKALDNLAAVLRAQADYAGAEPLCRRALAINEKALGAEHPETATALSNLAALLRDQGDYAGAKPLCERALAISEKALGREHLQTATSLNNLASLLRDRGDLCGARMLFERALAIREKALGPEHPDTRTTRENLSNLPPSS